MLDSVNKNRIATNIHRRTRNEPAFPPAPDPSIGHSLLLLGLF